MANTKGNITSKVEVYVAQKCIKRLLLGKTATNLRPKMSETGKCFGSLVKTLVGAEDTG